MAARRAMQLGSVAARLAPRILRPNAGAAERSASWSLGRNARSLGGAAAAELEMPLAPPFPIVHTKLLINGEFVDSASGKTFPTIDPRSEEEIIQVSEGDVEDVNRAVKAARKAFDEGPWPRMPPHERGRIVMKFADLLEQHTEELAALDSLNGGKVYDLTKYVDLGNTVKVFRYYAGWADKIHGATIPSEKAIFSYTLHEPVGVVGSIIPWNFPMIMFANKVAPPLVLGNSIVLKTAEQTPLSALLAGKLALEAGIPPGVLNIISGYGPTAGAAVAEHMDIDVVAFTGSGQTGRAIMRAAANSNLKRVGLELGGKSGLIVADDADVDEAVAVASVAAFFNQGQVCCAGSRTFVQEKIYDEFMEKSRQKALERVVGDPFKSGVDQGPQVDSEQFNKVMKYIQKGQEQGATLVTGGERLGSKGYYIQPTVFGDVQDSHTIFKEEIFGPVQSVTKFKTIEEAIHRTNNSDYGLVAGIMTKNPQTANTVSRALKVGSVWVNCFFVLDPSIPFGGYKQSGFGRVKGQHALENYYNVKCVSTPIHNPAWL